MAEDDRGFLVAARLQLLQPLHGIIIIVIIMVIMDMIKIIIIGIVYCGWLESAHPPVTKMTKVVMMMMTMMMMDDDDDDDDDDHCCSSKDEERQGRISNTQSSDERSYKAADPDKQGI